MKKIFLSSLICLLSSFLFAQQINDPNAEIREAKNFHAIKVSNAFDVYLTQGNEEAVAVSASETKYRDRITVEVNNGELLVKYDQEGLHWSAGNKKLKVYISFKNIDKLELSGASDLFVKGNGIINAKNLYISLSGASDWKEGKLNAEEVTVHLSGASDMKVSGTVMKLEVDASGASDFKGYDLSTDYCNAKASGASNIDITVNKELSVNASGASDIHYKGGAMIKDMKTSGASDVSKKS